MGVRETLAKFEQEHKQLYNKLIYMKGQNGRGYCSSDRIAGYLQGLADAGIITDRERGTLYIYGITHITSNSTEAKR